MTKPPFPPSAPASPAAPLAGRALRQQADHRTPRILLVRLSAIGDCVHAVPVVEELRRRFPEAWLGWAIGEAGHHLLEGLPAIDRFHVLTKTRGTGGAVRAWRRLTRELRACRYETVIDVQGLTKSGLVARLAGARRRVGFAGRDARELNRWFINRPVAVGDDVRHVVDRNLRLLSALGIEAGPATWRLPSYELDDALSRWLGLAVGDASFAVIHPGTTWATKVWPADRFARVGKDLVNDSWRVLITWAGERERAWATEICAHIGAGAVIAPPTNLREMAGMIARAGLFVGCDSGPLHLAAALDVPAVGVFGATDPERNGPYGSRHAAFATRDLECWPCWKGRCARSDLACLMRIEPAEVVTKARALAAPSP